MIRSRRSNHAGEPIVAQRSLKVAGVVIALILAVEVIAIVPILVRGHATGVQLMVIDKGVQQNIVETPTPRLAAEPQARPEPMIVEPPAIEQPTPQPLDAPMFNGRPIRKVRTMRMLVTAYSPDERSCGQFADGVTASGYSVWTNGMKLVAADTRLLPFKSIITIDGYNEGKPVPVLDRGGKIKGHRLDVLYPTHEIARKWGKQWIDVDVWDYAD